jgi:hypothetical protein
MKNPPYLTFLLFIITVSPLFAQLDKGTFMLGGSGRFSVSTSSPTNDFSTKEFSSSLQPGVLYFPVDRLAVGLNLPLGYSRSWSEPGFKWSYTTYGTGPTVRYYFPIGKFAIFPEFSFTFIWGNGKSNHFYGSNTPDLMDSKYSVRNNVWHGGAGITYFLNPAIGLEANLFYQKSTLGYDRTDYSYDNSLSNLNLNLGFQIYLARKAK